MWYNNRTMEKDKSQYVAQSTKNPRENIVRPKPIHYRVVKNLIENGGHKGKALIDAGYSEVTAQNPKKILETKSMTHALNSAGLSIERLNSYLNEDIEAKKGNRFQELQLAYKLHGKLKDTKEGDKTLILNITGESASRYKLDNKDEG